MAGQATRIVITIRKDGIVTVQDDGRGVPVGKHSTGKDALETVLTYLDAGGKFGGAATRCPVACMGSAQRRQRALLVDARRVRS